MKRITCLMIALFLMLPCRQSPAPIPIIARIVIQCLVASGIGATAKIIYQCDPNYWLCVRQHDGDDPEWFTSQASAATLRKTEATRWEGPWKDRKESDQRAWENNRCVAQGQPIMWPKGVLGAAIPSASYTNYTLVTIEQSMNGGKKWSSGGNLMVEPGESNWMICLLGPDGTNGLTHAEMIQLSEADIVLTKLPVQNEIKDYRVRGFVTELPVGFSPVNPSKDIMESQ